MRASDGVGAALACLLRTILSMSVLPLIGLVMISGVAGDQSEVVLRHMHRLNGLVMEAAALARTHAERDDVRAYARRLEMDHGYADDQVLELAAELHVEGVGPAPGEASQDRRLRERLAELEGEHGQAFDDDFLRLMTHAHVQVIDTVTGARRSLPQPLARMVDRVLPILEQHVQLAAHLTGRVEGTAEARR